MIVMKYGGSSVADAGRIRNVFGIVKARLAQKPLVIVSAFRGVTDDLLQSAQDALQGKEGGVAKLRDRHQGCLRDLGLDPGLVDGLLDNLARLLQGIALLRELTPRALDKVASFGERLSARVIAAHFAKAGVPAEAHDAFDLGLLTTDDFGAAQPLPEADAEIRARVAKLTKLPVVTGFIGKTRAGDIATLGRNGSDFSATIFGAALDAPEIQIWSDVDGIMTADPRLVPAARPIESLTFEEAGELAYYGGKVLHPATIIPAVRKGIPVRCLNTFKPDHPGTTILRGGPPGPGRARSIAHNLHNLVLTITSPRMLQSHGFLARLFEVFGRHRISVNMIATSEVSVSVTLDTNRNLEAAVEDLRRFAEVEVEKDMAIVCVVGQGLHASPGAAGDVFQALQEAGVNVRMISQGASEINIAFVVADAECQKAVQAVHRKFFDA